MILGHKKCPSYPKTCPDLRFLGWDSTLGQWDTRNSCHRLPLGFVIFNGAVDAAFGFTDPRREIPDRRPATHAHALFDHPRPHDFPGPLLGCPGPGTASAQHRRPVPLVTRSAPVPNLSCVRVEIDPELRPTRPQGRAVGAFRALCAAG